MTEEVRHSYPKAKMSIDDWTLLSDHLLEICTNINSVIGYQSEGLSNLESSAFKRVVEGLMKIPDFNVISPQSSPTTAKETIE